jgi:hypothetical protein
MEGWPGTVTLPRFVRCTNYGFEHPTVAFQNFRTSRTFMEKAWRGFNFAPLQPPIT